MTLDTSNDRGKDGPIFIVGMNGSGTTMLLDHLNSHSKIFGFRDETRILPYMIEKAGRLQADDQNREWWHLWREICSAFPFWKANSESDIPVPDDWAEYDRTAGAIFNYVMSYFAGRENKSIWCEKTPMHALHIGVLAAEFPDARFIHIIRDGRDCAASFQRRWNHDPKVSMYRWKKTIRAAREQAAVIDSRRYMEIRFEQLTQEPEKSLRLVCAFLGVNYEQGLLKTSRAAKRMRGIDSKEIAPNSGGFKASFSKSEIASLEEIGGALLHELGYDTNNKDGDRNLSRAYLLAKQFRTYGIRLGDAYRRTKKSRNPWTLFIGRIRSGIQYLKSNRY